MESFNVQRGASLLEVLIALLVITIGLLGVAAGLIYSVKNTHSAYVRSQANTLAYDLLEIMRAYRSDALAGEFDDTCSGSVACQARQDWDAQVANVLPSSPGVAVTTSVSRLADEQVSISLTWSDARAAVKDDKGVTTQNDPEQQTFVLKTRL